MKKQLTRWFLPMALSSFGLLLMACQGQAPDARAPEATPPAQTSPLTTQTDATPAAPAETAPEIVPTPAAEPVAAVPAPPPPPAAPPPPPPPPKPRPQAAVEQYGQVISSAPIRRSVDNPKEVCRDVEVVYQVAPKDENKIAGTAIGAIAGAVIGNQVGKGHGRDAARVAGAIGGAVAGRKIQESQQDKKTETRIERQCETVNDPTSEIIGYDIVYSVGGKTYEARVAEEPGPRIKLPVRSINP